MSGKVLVAYATTRGSTAEVAEAVAETLRESGAAVGVQLAKDVRTLEAYGPVVLGAPLYMFRWHKDAHRFLKRHREALQARPLAIFALGPTHEPHDEEEWQNSWDQLRKALANYPWLHPAEVAMFGGRYDPETLGVPLKWLAGDEPYSDIRDWDAIHAWAAGLAEQLG